MMSRGETHVLLDISHEPSSAINHHFPNIAARVKEYGIDITKDPIPVVPTQHYCCGGVQTGLFGETDIAGLYACGEVAHTGICPSRNPGHIQAIHYKMWKYCQSTGRVQA